MHLWYNTGRTDDVCGAYFHDINVVVGIGRPIPINRKQQPIRIVSNYIMETSTNK